GGKLLLHSLTTGESDFQLLENTLVSLNSDFDALCKLEISDQEADVPGKAAIIFKSIKNGCKSYQNEFLKVKTFFKKKEVKKKVQKCEAEE
ncbi:unnamed protein product, partial [Polarella glacialis]